MADTTTYPPAPECERLAAVAPESNRIGEFLDWLTQERKIQLAVWEPLMECSGPGWFEATDCVDGRLIARSERWDRTLNRVVDDGEDIGECTRCDGSGRVERSEPILVPASVGFEKLLAEFYDINLDKVDQERRAILDHLRTAQEG